MSEIRSQLVEIAMKWQAMFGVAPSKVPVYIHAVVKNTNHKNFGVSAFTVKNHMATLAEFSVSRLYITGILANLRLASEQSEGIVKLLQVFISLPISPFFSGKSADLNYVVPGGNCKQVWAHQ